MKRIDMTRPGSSALFRRVLEVPDVVSTVQDLPPEKLGALIHEVGLEDAGELVSLATTRQLQALFDDDVWRSDEGVEERFDAARFVLWLEVLWEAGESIVVQRMIELPREFLCFAVARLAHVVDMDELLGEVESDETYHDRVERALDRAAYEEWEEFRLIDRGSGGFDVLLSTLFALDTENADLLRALLERCRDLSSAEFEEHGGLVRALGRLEAAEHAVRGERQERRTQRGYVSLADARAFLKLVSAGIHYDAGRDPITHAYFREVYGKGRANADLGLARAPATSRLAEMANTTVRRDANQSGSMKLGQALQLLASQNPRAHDDRVEELVYLANVLVTASQSEARRVRPVEATNAALLVCAEGLRASGFGGYSAEEWVLPLESHLMDVLFRKGWPLVSEQSQGETASLMRDLMVAACAR